MTQATKRAFLVAEKAHLEALVSTLDDDSILERVGLESRLSEVTAELASIHTAAGRTAVDVVPGLFEPAGSPAADAIIDHRDRPAMTTSRAAILGLMGRYSSTSYEYRLSLVEVQKLAYFLQEAGEPLRLQFKAHFYGPYADNLRKALRNIEGHYTRGLADGKNSPETPLELLPGALEEAEAHLAAQPASLVRLERVARLIDVFETPFGMELLSTVHWVMHHSPDATDVTTVLAAVQHWSDRKRSQMKAGHIEAAWKRLREQGWAPA
jgi:hypothetical protein